MIVLYQNYETPIVIRINNTYNDYYEQNFVFKLEASDKSGTYTINATDISQYPASYSLFNITFTGSTGEYNFKVYNSNNNPDFGLNQTVLDTININGILDYEVYSGFAKVIETQNLQPPLEPYFNQIPSTPNENIYFNY
jgi:hypothetical protein